MSHKHLNDTQLPSELAKTRKLFRQGIGMRFACGQAICLWASGLLEGIRRRVTGSYPESGKIDILNLKMEKRSLKFLAAVSETRQIFLFYIIKIAVADLQIGLELG